MKSGTLACQLGLLISKLYEGGGSPRSSPPCAPLSLAIPLPDNVALLGAITSQCNFLDSRHVVLNVDDQDLATKSGDEATGWNNRWIACCCSKFYRLSIISVRHTSSRQCRVLHHPSVFGPSTSMGLWRDLCPTIGLSSLHRHLFLAHHGHQ